MAREVCEDKSKGIIASASSGGYLYSDISSGAGAGPGNIHAHLVNSMQHAFDGNPEIFNLSSSMEMIGFNKNYFVKHGNTSNAPGPSSSSKSADFYPHHHQEFVGSDNLIVGAEPNPWHDQNRILLDDSNIRCVFPCEGNERPSQGLSLSLSSNNPTSIGLQSFELRHTNNHHHHHQQASLMNHQGLFQLRNSKFLAPSQELLNEFVSLGAKQVDSHKLIKQSSKNKQWEDMDSGNGSSSRKQALNTLEFIELQKRKAKLLSMLEEVDRRYKHYCDQMKAVVSSFEAVAGFGAAAVYSALASKAMSRHFRCLRDGIVGQIQATRKAMGEKDPVAPGGSRGETPRLRVLDQTLRQQRAFQQMTMMESHPWRPQRGLPERSVSVLRAWLFEHFLHPYPSDVDKHILARQTGLSRSQVSNWFINARVRLWKPMIEEMYMEELKEREEADENNDDNNNMASNSDGILNGGADVDENCTNHHNPNPNSNPQYDQKPGPEQLVRVDSECLSSIVTHSEKNELKINHHQHQQQQHHHHGFGNFGNGPIELEFSSYSHHHHHHNVNNGGVSLTLGLQQHAGSSGVSLAFSPVASQTSLFYGRDQMEDCQPVQYSLLDGEAQHLPYRNLMGAQLLHDLAG